MFKNFWYALAFSDEITNKPSQHRLLGQDLVLYRGSDGKARALSDVCIHRGAPLSSGWVENDTVVCPYHGWGYNGEGVCTRIPALRQGRPLSKKARVDAYPVEERHGWIWVFPGDIPEAERVPIPNLEFMDDPSFRQLRGEWHWDANFERVVENGTDIAHTPWVHGTSFGNRDEPEVEDLDIESWDWGAKLTAIQRPPQKAGGLFKRKHQGRPPEVTVSTAFFFPSIVMIDIQLSIGRQIIWDTNIPLDENTTLTKWVGLRNFFTGGWADRIARKRVLDIFAQDDEIVKRIKPELIPPELSGELHLKSDGMSLEYRRCRQAAVDRGWSVIGTAAGGPSERTVIASPGRTQEGLSNAWVLKPTPEGTGAIPTSSRN